MKEAYIAVDFGGGSGRVIAGTISGNRLVLDELHRFANRRVTLGNTTYWDFPALFADMIEGLRKAARQYRIVSLAIDTWGVDFGLIDCHGNLVGNPVSYRDPAVNGLAEEYFESRSLANHYAEAGIQVMDINTMFRLIEMKRSRPELLAAASRLLFMPDLFSYFLTGEASCEYSIASTSELLDARSRSWNLNLIESLGLPAELFPPVIMPGTVRGTLLPSVAAEIGVDYPVNVIAAASHDTASAIHTAMTGIACPATTAYLSSGTWSLLGVVSQCPVLTEEARIGGFSNEGGTAGRICLLQNITGLWILQQLMAEWESRGEAVGHAALEALSRQSSCAAVIDVDNPVFASAKSMEAAISDYCRAGGIEVPQSKGDFARCVMHSLALRYRKGVEEINRLLPRPLTTLRIIGGGSLNGFLNELTARETGLEVIAGPAEATAIGNILIQAEAAGINTESINF